MPPTYSGAENIEIIIADDEEDNIDVAVMSLGMVGYDENKFAKVSCGEETIEKVKEMQAGDPDVPLVVLLDLNMPPKMGGAECAKILKSMDGLDRPPMLVCCSAGKVSDIKLQSYSTNFVHFITKPFSPSAAEDLLVEIEKWVDSKQ